MSFFENLFHHKKRAAESVVLIDIGASSVAGAYARYLEGGPTELLYSRRLPIEIRKDETHGRAMLRALDILGNDLVREGAPVLARVVGKGNVDVVLVSIDAPWQETKVHTERFEQKEPFVFTKSLITKRLEEVNAAPPDKTLVDESIIGTILNGYGTRSPYGKKAHRASVIVLTSLIERQIANSIISALESLYHTKRVIPIAGSSLRYQAIRDIFPHERDALILDATGRSLTSISLVRKGNFVDLIHVSTPSDDGAWVPTITSELADLAKRYPLPRTIFLLTRESETSALRQKLDAANFASLWLSANPPKIIPVSRNHVAGSIKQTAATPPDIVLLFMTLYYEYRHRALNEPGFE